jgi:hypothetical protein
LVVTSLHLTFVHERLEIGAVLYAIRRVDIDRLDFASHSFLLVELDTVSALSHGFDDGARINALMDVEGNGGDFECCVFGFPCPDERGVKMWVIGIGLFSRFAVGVRGYKTNGRVVASFFAFVVVLQYIIQTPPPEQYHSARTGR